MRFLYCLEEIATSVCLSYFLVFVSPYLKIFEIQRRVSLCVPRHGPLKALRGGISKVNFQETLSISGNKCPQDASKNDPMAPRTTLECPHEGPSVEYHGANPIPIKTSFTSNRFHHAIQDWNECFSQWAFTVQGYVAHKKVPPPRTLRWAYA